MSDTAPRRKEPADLFAMEGVARVSGKSGLALVDSEVEPPGFPDDLDAEQVKLLSEEHVQTALLVI